MNVTETPSQEAPQRAPRLTRADYERFSPFIRRQAIWLARRSPCRVTVQTLCAHGWQGLLDALASHHEVGDVTDIDAFVEHRVKTAMLQLIELIDEKNKAARTMAQLVTRSIAALTRALGRSPTSTEVAEAMSVDTKQYEEALAFTFDAGVARLYGFEAITDPGPAADDEVLSTTLGEAIAMLDERFQTVLLLVYQEDCSHDEVASIMDLHPRKVKVLHAEAIFRLRVLLGRE